MELVIIVSTITAFFSHYLIEKGIVANAVSVVAAMLITWSLASIQIENRGEISITDISIADISITLGAALVISLIVGLVFAQHKKCSK